MDSKVLDDKILNIDIFKSLNNSRIIKLPDFAERILTDLKNSLKNIREETIHKRNPTNEDFSKILIDLETNIKAILAKNLLSIKSRTEVQKLIKLGGLYEFASRNNSTLKKYLNSFYLTSRVYKGLLKNHPLMQDLQFRLLNVRRKVILETYKNEARKGKLHHLRSSKAVKTVSNIPKRLKYIVKKCNKEIMKCMGKDNTINGKQFAELSQLIDENQELTEENICKSIEESLIDYYGRMQPDNEKTQGYISSLMEISEAQNKQGEHVLLNYCDQEMAMEYLCLESEEVRHDFMTWESVSIGGVGGDIPVNGKQEIAKVDTNRIIHISLCDDVIVDAAPPVTKMHHTTKVEVEESDVLDFEDFQLVDEWESRAEDDKKCDESIIRGPDDSTSIVHSVGNVKESQSSTNDSCSRRRRRTRFGPVSEEFILEQMQQGNLGFSSTFVDEEENGTSSTTEKTTRVLENEKTDERKDEKNKAEYKEIKKNEEDKEVSKNAEFNEVKKIDECKEGKKKDMEYKRDEMKRKRSYTDKHEEKKIKIVEKHEFIKREMFDVVAKSDEEKVESPIKCVTSNVPLSRGELCKSMLTRFHDTLCDVLTVSHSRHDWLKTVAKITEPWSMVGDHHYLEYKSSLTESVVKDAIKDLDNRLQSIIDEKGFNRDTANVSSAVTRCDTPQAYSTASQDHASIPQAYSSRSDQSPSPTTFDQTIEASLTKSRGPTTPWHPLVGPRPTKTDGNTSPDKSRFRAIMLSYKRDIKKQKDDSLAKDKEMLVEEVVPGVDNVVEKMEEGECEDQVIVSESDKKIEESVKTSMKQEKVIRSHIMSDSEGMLTSSEEEGEESIRKKPIQVKKSQSKVQWLAPHPDKVAVVPLPPPAATFIEGIEAEDSGMWTDRKVFVVDAHNPTDAVAPLVKAYLHRIGAKVFDTSSYKHAGKGLHVLVHNDWRFPESCVATPLSSPVSLLFLKNNSEVHFLSYSDLETVVQFECSTVFPHSRTCVFLDQQALANTHPDNVRNMLDFMINERESADRIWCLKIVPVVYNDFCDKIKKSEACEPFNEVTTRLKAIQSILIDEYLPKYSDQDSLALVEIVHAATDSDTNNRSDKDLVATQHEQVLHQQYFLQRKFRHFCILTDDLNTTELDIRYLSTNGIAVLPLRTFLTNKIKKFVD